jgi:hypothetical protein
MDEQKRFRPRVEFYDRGESAREALRALLATPRLAGVTTKHAAAARPVRRFAWVRRLGLRSTEH